MKSRGLSGRLANWAKAMALEFQSLLILLALITAMACLYSSVGHGGASGYIAAMALLGLSVLDIKPVALTMNIAVSALALYFFARHMNWKVFIPLTVMSIPMAFLGGASEVSPTLLKIAIGFSLMLAAIKLFSKQDEISNPSIPSIGVLLATGGALGFVAGLTGVGGAIYLSPILYVMQWANMRTNAAISGGFVFVNSIAGLAGYLSSGNTLPSFSALFIATALAGAIIGASLGSRTVSSSNIRKLLGVVLVVAGGKLIFTTF